MRAPVPQDFPGVSSSSLIASAALRTITVLLVCDHVAYPGGLHGSGRMMVAMATGFDPGRVRIVPVVLQEPGPVGHQLLQAGVPLHFLGYHRFDPRQMLRLISLVRDTAPDVLHLWDFGAATYGRLAAELTNTPAIVHVRSHHSRYQRRGFPAYVEVAYRRLASRTALAIANSESTRAFALTRMGFRPDQVRVIHNPVAPGVTDAPDPAIVAGLRRRYAIPEGAPVIGALTRFFPAKGIGYLVQAFGVLAPRYPELRLLLAGDGPLRDQLEQEARATGAGDRVIFAGPVETIAEHLALLTVAAMPSLEEAFGNSAIEAMTAGVPVVASSEGGLREIVEHGRTGFLVPPAAHLPLAGALARILDDAALRAQMAAACRDRRERFSFSHYALALESCYREVAARKSRP